MKAEHARTANTRPTTGGAREGAREKEGDSRRPSWGCSVYYYCISGQRFQGEEAA